MRQVKVPNIERDNNNNNSSRGIQYKSAINEICFVLSPLPLPYLSIYLLSLPFCIFRQLVRLQSRLLAPVSQFVGERGGGGGRGDYEALIKIAADCAPAVRLGSP